jgi:hypothetical protein
MKADVVEFGQPFANLGGPGEVVFPFEAFE